MKKITFDALSGYWPCSIRFVSVNEFTKADDEMLKIYVSLWLYGWRLGVKRTWQISYNARPRMALLNTVRGRANPVPCPLTEGVAMTTCCPDKCNDWRFDRAVLLKMSWYLHKCQKLSSFCTYYEVLHYFHWSSGCYYSPRARSVILAIKYFHVSIEEPCLSIISSLTWLSNPIHDMCSIQSPHGP